MAAQLVARGIASLMIAAGLLHVSPGQGGPAYTVALNAIHTLAIVAIALFALLRGRHDPRAILLALVLLPFANLLSFNLPGLPRSSATALVIGVAPGIIWAFCWPLFCMHVSGGNSVAWQRRWMPLVALATSATTLAQIGSQILGLFPQSFGTTPAAALVLFAVVGTGFLVLLWNYQRNDQASRNRIKIILLAFTTFPLTWLLSVQGDAAATSDDQGLPALFSIGVSLGALSGTGLIAYAVLRQKLFDFSFALNRTLVYAAVSFILLAGFGLAEWAVEHFHLIPEAWHEGGGSIASAGIALALFLSFHRLRDWVERHVERLFFRRWHENESALRRFVACAANYEKGPALCRDFAQELSRFAGGAATAVYLRDATGSYVLQAGALAGAATAYPPDGDPLFALMRTERKPIELSEIASALPAALGLPMLNQGRLFGFALVTQKGDASRYRPDEVNVLGWATLQVGHDLQAINAGDLEAEVMKLRDRVGWPSGKSGPPRRRAARAA